MTLYKMVLVFLGGGLGSISRYLIAIYLHSSTTKIPVATLIANIVSCFILGISYKYYKIDETQYWIWFFVMIGFCGGMSTFSTFTAENFQLIQQAQFFQFASYTIISLVLCLIFFWLGIR